MTSPLSHLAHIVVRQLVDLESVGDDKDPSSSTELWRFGSVGNVSPDLRFCIRGQTLPHLPVPGLFAICMSAMLSDVGGVGACVYKRLRALQ